MAQPDKQRTTRHRPSPILVCAVAYSLAFLAIIWHYYPGRIDRPEKIHFEPTPEQKVFYNEAFDARQARYARIARQAAALCHI